MSSVYETHIGDVITLYFLVLKCLQQFSCSSCCCDIGQTCIGRCQDDIFPRIELNPSFVLSSDNNCKNDIQ